MFYVDSNSSNSSNSKMLSTLGLGLLLAGRVGAFGSPTADAGRRGADDLVPARSLQEEVQEVAALKPITLRGGVLNAPPFAIDNGDGTYSGFQGDLLRRLSQFALEDDVSVLRSGVVFLAHCL